MTPLFRCERRSEQLLGRRALVLRLVAHFGVATAVVAIALTLGAIGRLVFAQAAPVDAFYGATMILTGMGSVDQIKATFFTSLSPGRRRG